MFFYNILCVLVFVLSLSATVYCENLEFPKGFLLGAGSSAYQVEGAWNVSGEQIHHLILNTLLYESE